MAKKMDLRLLRFCVLLVFAFLASVTPSLARTGVLIIAKDRGVVGNQELAATVAGLDPAYPSTLLLIGPDRQGIEQGYAAYIAAAREVLREKGVDEIIAIPLFVSGQDHLYILFRDRIAAAMRPATMRWMPALGESYLAREILLDRIRAADPGQKAERLVLLLSGASDAASAREIRALGEALLRDIRPLAAFPEMAVVVTYSEMTPGVDAEAAEAEANALLEPGKAAGYTLLIPFIIDVKFSPEMSLEESLATRYHNQGASLRIAQSIVPHSAIRVWLQSMINLAIPVTDETIGIIIMPHGSTTPYNDGIIAAMPQDIVSRYPTAYAFGMASPFTIEQAVRRLERAGVRHGVFLRLFSLPHHFREASDYILGLQAMPPEYTHGSVPERVRTAIRFVTLGGYQADPLISGILKDRILEVSREPSRESVILLAHGAMSDAADAQARAVVEGNIADIKAMLETPFRAINAMSLREDWPDKRAGAVRAIRHAIQEANKNGRAIVVSNRLYGSGAYAQYLQGLDYDMNSQGLIPHPDFTRWVEKALIQGITTLKSTPIE